MPSGTNRRTSCLCLSFSARSQEKRIAVAAQANSFINCSVCGRTRSSGVQRLFMNPRKPDEKAIAEAALLLEDGQLVAFPTETVYGLGADATNPDALTRLYAVKGRPI